MIGCLREHRPCFPVQCPMNMPLNIARTGVAVFLAMALLGRTTAGADIKPQVEGNMGVEQVDVALPKFKITSEFGLAETLRAMGMEDAFDPRKADFSGMDGKLHWLYISAVLHKAYVDVYEKGTEAAAATGVTMVAAGIPMAPNKQFRADHPFIFLIRDSTTGSILFLGRVTRPSD